MARLLVIFGLLFPLAGWAEETTQRVEGLDVDKVMVFGAAEVEISQGEPVLLLLRGSDEDLARQPFFVDGSTLVLGKSKDKSQRNTNFSSIQFKLTLPKLEAVQLIGSADVFVRPLKVEDLLVAIEGSGDIKMFDVTAGDIALKVSGSGDIQLAELEARSVKAIMSGSGDIQLGGVTAEKMEASLTGSGDISVEENGSLAVLQMNIVGSGDMLLDKVDAKKVEINIVGSGTARVGDSSAMEVNVLGSGDIIYRGNPEITKSILGSGELHRTD